MANLSDYFGPVGSTAEQWDIKTGKNAYIASGKVTGTGYFPAMMQYNGTTGYYLGSHTSSGNKTTLLVRFNRASFTGGAIECIARADGPTSKQRVGLYLAASDYVTAGRRSKIWAVSQNSAGTNICRLFSASTVCDGENHTVFYDFDGDSGTATFMIDGVSATDSGNAEHVAPTTGTLDSGALSLFSVGATSSGTLPYGGKAGFVGARDTDSLTWSDFMQTDGTPKQLDEATWTEWGAQPLFWNEHGDMVNNLGSAGAMTKNGTINVTEGGGGVAGMTANAWDIKTGKSAYLAGGSATGTGYFPAMMQIASGGYYLSDPCTTSGQVCTVVLRLIVEEFTGSARRVFGVDGDTNGRPRISAYVYASDDATTDQRNKMGVFGHDASGQTVLLISSMDVCDGLPHTVLIAFDAANGTAVFIVDGADAINTGATNHDAMGTYTMLSGSSSRAVVGNNFAATEPFVGMIGFFGYRDAYLTNWPDFMQTDGTPKQLDESTWTEWGAQPLFWHESGRMTENKGSAGAMTANGTIILAAASSWS